NALDCQCAVGLVAAVAEGSGTDGGELRLGKSGGVEPRRGRQHAVDLALAGGCRTGLDRGPDGRRLGRGRVEVDLGRPDLEPAIDGRATLDGGERQAAGGRIDGPGRGRSRKSASAEKEGGGGGEEAGKSAERECGRHRA